MLLASRDQAERGTRLGPLVAAWRTGVKPVWKIVTKSGFELSATADHKVLTTAGWVPVEDLVPSVHKLLIQSGEGKFPEDQKLPFKPSNIYIEKMGRQQCSIFRPSGPRTWPRLGVACRRRLAPIRRQELPVGFTFANSDAPVFATLRPILNRWYGRNIAWGTSFRFRRSYRLRGLVEISTRPRVIRDGG